MTIQEKEKLHELVGRAIERSSTQDRIEPGWVANAVLKIIDKKNVSPVLVRMAALLALKQIARHLLAKSFEGEDIQQHKLFPDLQAKYPVSRNQNEEPLYVKLELLSKNDLLWNIKRLRKESAAKAAHADSLEAWGITHKVLKDEVA